MPIQGDVMHLFLSRDKWVVCADHVAVEQRNEVVIVAVFSPRWFDKHEHRTC